MESEHSFFRKTAQEGQGFHITTNTQSPFGSTSVTSALIKLSHLHVYLTVRVAPTLLDICRLLFILTIPSWFCSLQKSCCLLWPLRCCYYCSFPSIFYFSYMAIDFLGFLWASFWTSLLQTILGLRRHHCLLMWEASCISFVDCTLWWDCSCIVFAVSLLPTWMLLRNLPSSKSWFEVMSLRASESYGEIS